MIPVYQEIILAGSGDCFSACVASLLEIPLDAVPKFARDHGAGMMDAARAWLIENFNLAIVTIRVPDVAEIQSGDEVVLHPSPPGTPCIASVPSPNLPGRDHAVVGEIDETGMDFKMTHDPNKNGKPITTAPKFLYFFVPMRPQTGNHFNRCARCNEFPTVETINNETGLKCACRGYLLSESEWKTRTLEFIWEKSDERKCLKGNR